MGTATTPTSRTGPEPGGYPALLCWLSPAFPVGAYAYSHGLEWAVAAGDVRDEPTLRAWLVDILRLGAGRNDAILLSEAHRATAAGAWDTLTEANELALTFAPSTELRLETAQQGRSFLDAVLEAWPAPGLAEAARQLDAVAYPIALGLAAAAHGIPLPVATPAFLTAFAGNLVSAAIRLAPIGQNAGQRVLAALVPDLVSLAREIPALGLDDLAGPTLRADLGSFRHETQYTRLFRS